MIVLTQTMNYASITFKETQAMMFLFSNQADIIGLNLTTYKEKND